MDFPSPQTGDQWQLTPQGWVGLVPLTRALTLALAPRVPLSNLFGMLAYAWDLRSFHLLAGLTHSTTIADFTDQLAAILAQRVLALMQQGPYQSYEPRMERRAALRGRLDLPALARAPWQATLPCRFAEQTVDCAENRVLLWTLHRILQADWCAPRVAATVRLAQRRLRQSVTLVPCTAADLDGWAYHRLNAAYRPLHTLCRFILQHSGPALVEGDAPMIPFLVNMARLFEAFVAAWLAAHLPEPLTLRAQEPIPIPESALTFIADGVICARATGTPLCVFDTKYTTPAEPATDDVAQVVAYAHALHCPRAVLIYPAPLARPLSAWVGDTQVQSATFGLGADLDQAGIHLMETLGFTEARLPSIPNEFP